MTYRQSKDLKGRSGRAKRVGFFKFGSGRVRVLEKTSGSGSGSGIGTVFFINRVLSGNENIDRVFSGISICQHILQVHQ